MITVIPSAALFGVDAFRVDVEIDVAGGLPQLVVVGLAATTVKEGGSRIRSALRACGQELPPRRVTINLAPADRKKDGAAFDLPIALGVLGATGAFDLAPLAGLMIIGELGLDGALRPVRGVLAAAALARAEGLRGVLVPEDNAAEAAVVDGLEVYAAPHLAEVLRALLGEIELPRGRARLGAGVVAPPDVDLAEVRGQGVARRAVEIAVSGGHNLLLYGPPGIGKTMLARRIPGLLPAMSRDEAIEVTRIYSAAGLPSPEGLASRRPFRAPHHTASPAALVGGGSVPRPGEVSLAHRGVLFLDELPEFQRGVVESLRQPLEDRFVRISRAQGTVELPASFLLVASANPCPCGWYGSEERTCVCPTSLVERYAGRVSGPLLDRIDLQVRVKPVALADLRRGEPGEPTAAVRARVEVARERQRRRLAAHGALTNAEMSGPAARATCKLTPAAERFLEGLFAKQSMSARGVDRLLRVARTVADLEAHDVVEIDDVREASSLRALDRDRALGDAPALPARRVPSHAGRAPAGDAGARDTSPQPGQSSPPASGSPDTPAPAGPLQALGGAGARPAPCSSSEA